MRRFGLLIFFVAISIAAPSSAQTADTLIGLWGAQLHFGPALKGPITIRKNAASWSAAIGDRHASSKAEGNPLRFDFGGDGEFRGELRSGAIRGFWLQPAGKAGNNPDPGGAAQSFATLVVLKSAGANVWRGTIAPLENDFTLWLSIFRAPDGSVLAAFRNPQLNSTGGASRFQVLRNGADIRFSVKAGDREIVRQAVLLNDPDRIRVEWPDLGESIDLRRRNAAEATSFFPRLPASPPYVYRRPPQLSDGWRTARAAQTGIDEQALQSMVTEISSSDPTARPPQLMHSILVAHRGKLVLEEYFFGFDRSTPHDIRSAGKTFTSILLGTAPARAAGLSPDSHIYDVMRRRGPFENPDPRKVEITLAHLMTQTSGLACNDNDDASPGNEGTMQSQRAEPDWWRYALNLPQIHEPGTRYAYCQAINLVGGALTEATHIWLPELFRRTIAEPLQFGEWHWNLMANGEGYLGGGAFLLPRDFLKIGQMYLNGGVWNGRRIVPAAWVRESTKVHAEITPQTTGLSDEEFSNFYIRGDDGLAWHLGTIESSNRTYRTYSAVGNGGQLLVVVPDADLVVVFTGANYNQGGVWLRWPQQIIGDKIIPAIPRQRAARY